VTYVDPERDNRSIPCDLYYPAIADGPDQPVAEPPANGFAAVAFGHGYLISAEVYAWVAEKLAAIGCVVALPRTGGELFPDHAEFGLDLAFVTRILRDANGDPASPFFERMGSRAMVMGHSMGGGCSFLAAASDPTITAAVNFAAAETDPSAIAACAQLDIPTLMFSGTNDCVTPPADHQLPMYDALAGGWRTLVTITGASHCQFNSYSFVCELGEFCSADISRQEQQDRVWLLLEPWALAVLFLDAAAGEEFQIHLAEATGFTYMQSGTPTPVASSMTDPANRIDAYPNPFNPAITLRVDIGRPGRVRLAIFDVAGREWRVLAERFLAAGSHHFQWDGRDSRGHSAPSGVYLARVTGDKGITSQRITLVR
jgi:dienelactone hydrolase